jgi:hypothetical protein
MDNLQFLDAWEIHNRINLYLLEAVEAASLNDQSASKGRTVGEQFAHLHNVRLMWLKPAAPDLLKGLNKIEKEQAGDKKLLSESLIDSGEAIKTLLAKSNRSRRQDQKLQAARVGVPGLFNLTRVASSRTDHAVAQTGGPSGRQENSVWHLGVGRAVDNSAGLLLFLAVLPDKDHRRADPKRKQEEQEETDQQQLSLA